jgi:two-component system response regulator YesN
MLAEEAGPPPAPVAGAAAVAPLPYEARNDLLRALAGGNAAGVRHQLEWVATHVLAARPPAGELLAFAAELVVMAEDAVRQHTSTPGAAADYARRRAELVASASAAPNAQALFAWLGQAVEELLCLLTAGSGGGQASANPFVRMARQYMQENYSRNLSTAEIADHVKLNRSYLSELYSRETGETLSEALARIRMEAAKEMLKEGRMKVYEVAEAAGYSDSKIFTKAFKRMTGLTPKKFQ